MWRKYSDDCLPEEGRLLECTTDKGNVVELIRRGNLFYVPNQTMYVYYSPVMWRYKEQDFIK